MEKFLARYVMIILIPYNVASSFFRSRFSSRTYFLAHMGEPNPSNKIKYLRYIGLIGPRIIKFQIFMTFSNKYNFDAVLSNLFKGYLKKQNVFQFIIKVTVTLTPHES